jgi:hypothetical protein
MVRDIVKIPGKNDPKILFLINDQYPALYELKNGLQNKHSGLTQ